MQLKKQWRLYGVEAVQSLARKLCYGRQVKRLLGCSCNGVVPVIFFASGACELGRGVQDTESKVWGNIKGEGWTCSFSNVSGWLSKVRRQSRGIEGLVGRDWVGEYEYL